MRRAYYYKAIINKQTEVYCIQWLELCRNLYNQALDQRIKFYRETGETMSGFKQMSQLPALRKSSAEFRAVGSQVLQDVIQRLDKACKSFFHRVKQGKGKVGLPRFKGCGRYDSFTLKKAGWKLEGKYLHVKHVGRFKLFLSRPIEGNIKTVTIRRSTTNQWFVSFSCDDVPVKKYIETNKEVGIDVGIKHFIVDSQGNYIENPKYLRQSESVLRRRQRSLCRKIRGSANRKNSKLLVAKAHRKVVNQRNDFLHKTANYYIENYAKIFVENLKITNMVKNRHLSKSIADSSWGRFFEFLTYKAEEAGREVFKVNPMNTSQNCSGCGVKVGKSLSVRTHNCPYCGLIMDRDLNASLNILRLGQSRQALTDRLQTTVARESAALMEGF